MYIISINPSIILQYILWKKNTYHVDGLAVYLVTILARDHMELYGNINGNGRYTVNVIEVLINRVLLMVVKILLVTFYTFFFFFWCRDVWREREGGAKKKKKRGKVWVIVDWLTPITHHIWRERLLLGWIASTRGKGLEGGVGWARGNDYHITLGRSNRGLGPTKCFRGNGTFLFKQRLVKLT